MIKAGEKLKYGLNILEVQVPPQLRVRCPVATTAKSKAMKWFDDALGGKGLTPSCVMMLTGVPGGGKSTMMLMIADALTGAQYNWDQERTAEGNWVNKRVPLGTNNRHQVIYNSGEESVFQIAMVAERLKLTHGFHVGNDMSSSELFARRDRVASEHPNSRIIILQDSLQTLDDGKYAGGTNSASPVRSCKQLTAHAKKTYDCVVFVGQVNKSGEFSGSNKIKHDTDVHGHLYFDKDKRSDSFGERLFTAQKNRFGCCGRTYMLGMDDRGLFEKGRFELETTGRG